ncbi:MAG: type II toxin-antitoxin system VapC family toxin [Anaerolineae bacterium]
MTVYLLDTNHVSAVLEDKFALRKRIEQHAATGRFCIAMPILGELYFRAYASRRPEKNLAQLARFLDEMPVWDYGPEEAREYGRIQAEQKRRGLPIPPIDAQIAAVARIHNLVVLTADHHFQYVDGLLTENWLEGGV